LILHILDRSEPLSDDLSITAGKTRLILLNKSDLENRLQLREQNLEISCANGAGIEELKDTIKDLFWRALADSEMNEGMINPRHEEALRRARSGIDQTIQALDSNAS